MIPEIIIQRALIKGFKDLREDSRLLDTILRNLNQDQLEAAKNMILNTPIDFSVNFPRKEPTLPSLVLVLKGEGEAQAFLGDVMGDKTLLSVPMPDVSNDTLLGHGGSISGSSGLPVKVAGPLGVASQAGSNSLFLDEGEDITHLSNNLLDFPAGCLKLHVVDGAGAGGVYDILALGPETIKIIGSFDPPLDNTSVVDVRKPEDPELADGEPSRVYSHDGSYLRKGVNYEVNYNLHIMSGHQEELLYLYATVKAILLKQRAYIEAQGIMNLKMGGTDFAPRTEFLPDEVFQRMMTLQFIAPFDILEEQDTYSSIQIDFWVEDSVILGYPIQL
jgi:hypothetical protein